MQQTNQEVAVTFSETLMTLIEKFYAESKLTNLLFQKLRAGQINKDNVSQLLIGIKYLISHTPIHLKLAHEKSLKLQYFPYLSEYFAHHIEEEVGHDQWAAEDLEKLKAAKGASSTTLSPNIVKLVLYIENLIQQDYALYLPYILYAEYISVVVVPELVHALGEKSGIGPEFLSVLTKHSVLDVDHVKEDQIVIDKIVALNPIYQEKFLEVLETTYAIYSDFLNDVASDKKIEKEEGIHK